MRFSLLLSLALCGSALAQAPTTPKAGSPERKALMDALRVPIEKLVKQKVIFQVDHLKVLGQWAFMTGKPRTSKGTALDYKNTRYQEYIEQGAFDDGVCALFKKSKGKWSVTRYSLGATDVPWDGWDKSFGAPRAIFPYGN